MPEEQRFEAVIVGAGPAGIFAAVELVRAGRRGIAVVEKGEPIDKRSCPARQAYCVNCPTCDITTGWGGAGAFSDGKLTLTPDVGGWLGDYLDRRELEELIGYVDGLWVEFGADSGIRMPDEATAQRLIRQAVLADMRLVVMPVRHIGTDRSPDVLADMYEYLVDAGVTVLTSSPASRLLVSNGHVRGVELEDGTRLRSTAVIVAPGRVGAGWLADEASRLGIGLVNNAVDIGVRVEVPAPVMEPLTEPLYEAKLLYHSRAFGDEVRTFCMNPYGEVTTECYGDIVTVNGHSYAEERTENTNFAVLVSQSFTKPFRDPIRYGKSIASLANLLGEGIIVQRLGDLQAGRRSTSDRLRQSVIQPTLPQATPGDLSFVLPYRHLADILEFIQRLDHLAPGVASPGSLLYGVEVKFYSSRLEVDSTLMTQVSGLYAVGDGAGVTRGLVQSSASGIVAARGVLAQG